MFVLDGQLDRSQPDSTPSWADPVNMECLEIPQRKMAKLSHTDGQFRIISLGITYWTNPVSSRTTHTQLVLVSLLPASLPAKPTAVLNLLLPSTFLALLLRSLMLSQLLWDPRDRALHQHLFEIVPITIISRLHA